MQIAILLFTSSPSIKLLLYLRQFRFFPYSALSEAVQMLKAHYHRLPFIRIVAVCMSSQAQFVQNVRLRNFHFNHQKQPAQHLVLSKHGRFHLYRTFLNPWRLDYLRRLDCKVRNAKLVLLVPIATLEFCVPAYPLYLSSWRVH